LRNFHIFAPLAVAVCAPMYLTTILWNRYWFIWMRFSWARLIDASLVHDSLPFATSLVLSAALTPFVMRRLDGQARRQRTPGKFSNLILTILLFTIADTLVLALFTLGHRYSHPLLYLPVLALIVFFLVTIPVAVVEGKPPVAAFARSVALMKRRFFPGLALVGGTSVVFWLSVSAMAAFLDPASVGQIFVAITGWAMLILYFIFASVMVSVAYYLLRGQHDGLSAHDVDGIFD